MIARPHEAGGGGAEPASRSPGAIPQPDIAEPKRDTQTPPTAAAGDIASLLALYMLLRLAPGLVVRASYPWLADRTVTGFTRASTTGPLIGIVAALLVTWCEALGGGRFVGVPDRRPAKRHTFH